MNFFEWIMGNEGTSMSIKNNYYPILKIDLSNYIRIRNNVAERKQLRILLICFARTVI